MTLSFFCPTSGALAEAAAGVLAVEGVEVGRGGVEEIDHDQNQGYGFRRRISTDLVMESRFGRRVWNITTYDPGCRYSRWVLSLVDGDLPSGFCVEESRRGRRCPPGCSASPVRKVTGTTALSRMVTPSTRVMGVVAIRGRRCQQITLLGADGLGVDRFAIASGQHPHGNAQQFAPRAAGGQIQHPVGTFMARLLARGVKVTSFRRTGMEWTAMS